MDEQKMINEKLHNILRYNKENSLLLSNVVNNVKNI